MLSKSKHYPLPTFEKWIESNRFGCLGSDVSLKDGIEISGWWFNLHGISGIKKNSSLLPSDMVSVPSGDYIISDHDFEYILLAPKDDTEKPNYLVKRGDFEDVKQSLKNIT